MSVRTELRHKRRHPCPVCGGGDDDPRGRERRCHGWTTDDGEWAHCSREEFAGSIDADPSGNTWAHRLRGSCKCGQTHGETPSSVVHRPDDIEATYDYRDERGVVLFQVVRKTGKRFLQRRPDGMGGWVWQLGNTRIVPYRLPELLGAAADKTVFVVEGEKDADAVWRIGAVATTNPGGAGKWKRCADAARRVLAGRDVVVVADRDDVGRSHAQDVADDLRSAVKSVRVMLPPEPHKDVSDLLGIGVGLDALVPVDDDDDKPASADPLAPELPYDEIWTPEPEAKLVVPALGVAPGPAHLVTGSWYTGKTLFLMNLGMSVAAGRSLFGVWRTGKGRWIHFDHEMGRRHVKRYLQRVRTGLGISIEEMRDTLSLRVLPPLNLCTSGAADHYARLLDGCAICTLDPLRAAAPGADENKSEFRQYIDLLSGVSDRTGCAVVLLHHGGKPVEGASRRNTGRGTSAIDDAVQSKFVLTAEEKGAPILVTHEKTRELNQTLDPFYLRIESAQDAVRMVHMEPEQHLTQELPERAKAAIRETMAKYAGTMLGSRSDLARMVGGQRQAVLKAIAEMVAAGELTETREGSGRRLELHPGGQ